MELYIKNACTFLLFSVKLNSKCKKQDNADTPGPQRHSECVVPGEAHGKLVLRLCARPSQLLDYIPTRGPE